MGRPKIRLTAIYALLDPRDGAVRYVGKANNPSQRVRQHINEQSSGGMRRWITEIIDLGMHPKLEVIEWCESNDWESREQFWIAEHRKISAGLLNVCNGGNGVGEISQSTRLRMSAANLGKTLSTQHRAKIGSSNSGKKRSDQHRAKLSEANTGKRHSEETRAKIKASNLGKKRSAEFCRNLSLRQLGGKLSAKHRAKISEVNIGKKLSAETRLKMSESHIARWNLKRHSQTKQQ